MKRIIFFAWLFLGMAIFTQAFTQSEPIKVRFRITAVSPHPDGYLLATIDYGEETGIKAGTEGSVFGLWTDLDPDRATEIGYAEVTQTDVGSTEIRIVLAEDEEGNFGEVVPGDLVELPLALSGIAEPGLVFEMERLNVILTDIYDEPIVEEDILFFEYGVGVEEQALAAMAEDIRFVAGEMRGQMDDPAVEEGSYAGNSLFDVMEKATEEDVVAFLTYVKNRPARYTGHNWRVSEVFATWVVEGAPSGEVSLEWLNDLLAKYTLDGGSNFEEPEGDCGDLFLDLDKGTLSGVSPTESFEEIKEALPCFTGETEEGADYNCGGGIFYLNHQFFVYSHRDYIEVRTGFSGEISLNLLGKSPWQVENLLGKPSLIPVYPETEEDEGGLIEYEAETHYLYKRKYGTLRVSFDPNTRLCTEIAVHGSKPKKVVICW
jgi:hypothetical protein